MMHHLEADSILLTYGARSILSDIYVKMETGKIVGLLGRNGTGKTCLMNVIYGTLNPINKSIRLDGKRIERPFKSPELITYLPQFNFIPKALTIKKLFADFNVDVEAFFSFFPEFGDRLRLPLGRYSGGQRRLIEVYLIIKSKSLFSILDEPFTLLMPIQIEIIKNILIQEKVKKGYLITDHLYTPIIGVSDAVYMLKNGRTFLPDKLELESSGYV